jgi:hypothetical protein
LLSQIQQQRWTAQELQDELSQVVQRAEKLWSLQGAGRECGARCNNLKTALQNREVPENKQHNLRQLKYASMTSFLSTEMADFLVMPSLLSMSPSIRTGKAFLLAEGNTPARDIHLIRNLENPFRSPWFISDGSEKRFLLSITPFKATDLRHY